MTDNQTRDRILKTASELFIKYGLRSISMDDIAHHLGVSKKTIYQYFKDKDQIVTLTMSQYLQQEKATLTNIGKQSEDPIDLLLRVHQFLKRNVSETTANLVFELQKYHQKAWALMQEFRKEYLFNIVKDNIVDGVKEGVFRPEIDPEIATRMRLEQASMAFNSDIFPRTKFDFKSVADCILDHFVWGIATEKGRKLYQKRKAGVIQAQQI